MSKVRINALMPDNLSLGDIYNSQMALTEHSKTGATFVEDADGHDQAILSGTGFSYKGEDIVAGVVDKVTFADAKGRVYAVFDDLNIKVSKLPDLNDPAGFDADAFAKLAYHGNDRIVGSGAADLLYGQGGDDIIFAGTGGDWINGGRGDDRMTGGKGQDFFESGIGGGHDVITDFHPNGGDGVQDLLSLNASSWTAHQSGHDVVVEFGSEGDTVTLLNVKRSQISDADIFLTFGG